MKANELRIGNYHYYHIFDKFNDPQEWDDICQIDAEDLIYLSKQQGERDPDYRPIPITEEWLLKLGAEENEGCFIHDRFTLQHHDVYKFWYVFDVTLMAYITKVEFVHEWQNVYFVLNGQELTFKK